MSPSCCMASCNGLVCTASAFAPTRSSALTSSGTRLVGQLRQPDVADQQRVGRDVADREARRGRVVAQHDALRAEHHADAELSAAAAAARLRLIVRTARRRPSSPRSARAPQPRTQEIRWPGRRCPDRSGSARCRATGSAPGRWSRSGSRPPRSGTRRCARRLRDLHAARGAASPSTHPGTMASVSESLWIAIAVIAVLVVAALVVGLVRFRRGGSACSSRQTLPHRSTVPAGTPRLRASRSHNRQHRPAGPARSRPALDTSGLPAVGDDATIPRDAPKRPIADVQLPEPAAEPPSSSARAAEPEPPSRRAGRSARAGCARSRRHRAAGRPAGAAARPAGQVAERAGPQHARPARRRRPRRGLLGGRRGHPADRRPRARRHRIGGRPRCARGWPAAVCAPRPTPARCCARC